MLLFSPVVLLSIHCMSSRKLQNDPMHYGYRSSIEVEGNQAHWLVDSHLVANEIWGIVCKLRKNLRIPRPSLKGIFPPTPTLIVAKLLKNREFMREGKLIGRVFSNHLGHWRCSGGTQIAWYHIIIRPDQSRPISPQLSPLLPPLSAQFHQYQPNYSAQTNYLLHQHSMHSTNS